MTRISCGDWTKQTLELLQGKSEFPYTETQVLLAYVLNQSKEWLVSHPDELLTEQQESKLSKLVQRLLAGEPLPYMTGIQAFYGLDFDVNSAVLIPRPETELLVEEALLWLEAHPNRRKVIDIGTGSGAIAVTLADQISDLSLTAVDLSTEALEVARSNARKFSVDDRIQFISSDLFANVAGRFDLIAANLPYIPTATLEKLPIIRYEPRYALDGGADGLTFIRKCLHQVNDHIKPGGMILLEIEATQGDSAFFLAKEIIPDGDITLLRDYADLPRIIKIQL